MAVDNLLPCPGAREHISRARGPAPARKPRQAHDRAYMRSVESVEIEKRPLLCRDAGRRSGPHKGFVHDRLVRPVRDSTAAGGWDCCRGARREAKRTSTTCYNLSEWPGSRSLSPASSISFSPKSGWPWPTCWSGSAARSIFPKRRPAAASRPSTAAIATKRAGWRATFSMSSATPSTSWSPPARARR